MRKKDVNLQLWITTFFFIQCDLPDDFSGSELIDCALLPPREPNQILFGWPFVTPVGIKAFQIVSQIFDVLSLLCSSLLARFYFEGL